jgi:FkbM family methyltransferase
LVRSSAARSVPGVGRIWRKAWETACCRWDEPVTTRLHGRRAVLNFGNLYPITLRSVPTYNAPLVELVARTASACGRPIRMVDVGAAAGDSVLLILQRCPGMVERFDCVEGHDGFFELLERNLGQLPQCRLHHVVLSDAEGPARSLVRTHRGTASAQGDRSVATTTLDAALPDDDIDLLKVDTDGFDGKVLSGAGALLRQASPSVIFEWHPALCVATGTDPLLAFEALSEAGYRTFVFFTKRGEFSHFVDYAANSITELRQLADLCLTSSTLPDWHYDVIGLPPDSAISATGLADLAHATNSLKRRAPE